MTTYANGHGFKLSPPDQMKFQCFEKDDIPVDIDEVFEGGYCADKNGELFKIGNVEMSCCQCIRISSLHQCICTRAKYLF